MDATTDPATNELAGRLKACGVKYMFASYVDLHGVSKGKVVPIDHLRRMMSGSELCTGAALDGVPQDVSDEEVASHPDANSAIVLPWRKDTAWFASDLWLKGAPFDACSRNILKRVLARAADMGFTFNLGMEAEFFVLKDDPADPLGYAPVSDRKHLAKPAYDVSRMLDNMDWMNDLVTAMNDLGWDE